ncbi:MAG: PEGA domain-containing protein [Acidobacteria bacterium]|nr:PEGA domain-containing protein [Acidobacteriota bacterium]
MRTMRGFLLFCLAVVAFSTSLQGGHFSFRVPERHFFLPSRTLFFFQPDLYFQSHAYSNPHIYAPPIHLSRHHGTVTYARPTPTRRIYQLVVSGSIERDIVRANTTDLIFQVDPPQALLYIDGMLIGSGSDFATERDRYTILEGQHDLRIEFSGYQPFHEKMAVVANRTLHLDIQLEPLPEGSDSR